MFVVIKLMDIGIEVYYPGINDIGKQLKDIKK